MFLFNSDSARQKTLTTLEFSLHRYALLAACILVIACLMISGCNRGPSYPCATVIGKVTVDGKPVPKGAITFSPQKPGQGPVAGAPIIDGAYKCENVPLGKHIVTFTAQAAEMGTMIERATGAKREIPIDILPPAYRQGSEAEVVEGENTIDFPMKNGP